MTRTWVMNWLMLVVSCATVASSREKAFSPIRVTLMPASAEEGTARGVLAEATGPASVPARREGMFIPPEGAKMFVHCSGARLVARATDAASSPWGGGGGGGGYRRGRE